MNDTQRVTANLPRRLLREAQEVTGANITDTLIEALATLRRRRAAHLIEALRGNIQLDVDLEVSRERVDR